MPRWKANEYKKTRHVSSDDERFCNAEEFIVPEILDTIGRLLNDSTSATSSCTCGIEIAARAPVGREKRLRPLFILESSLFADAGCFRGEEVDRP